MPTFAILPAKSFEHAKQRLSREIPPAVREALAEAMLHDVLDALGRCSNLEAILLVSPSGRARRLARARGARVLADAGEGHNAAARLGIEAAASAGATRALLVPGDCPALEPAEVDELLARPHPSPSALIVPDRHRTGTNALLLTPPQALTPSFGPDSCARHAALADRQGVHREFVDVRSLALDIDTPEDLDSLISRAEYAPATASRTAKLLSRC